jgi:hypothetical protein
MLLSGFHYELANPVRVTDVILGFLAAKQRRLFRISSNHKNVQISLRPPESQAGG